MKHLIPVNSTERNPTEHAHYNDAISYNYLLLINGRYADGCFSFATNKWLVIEQFTCKIDKTSNADADLNRPMDWNPSEVIWFEEKES